MGLCSAGGLKHVSHDDVAAMVLGEGRAHEDNLTVTIAKQAYDELLGDRFLVYGNDSSVAPVEVRLGPC